MGLKVLLIAYECSPYRGSEWAVGWGRLLQAARVAEVHAIVSEANFADLTRARTEGLLPATCFFHTPTPDAELRRQEPKPHRFDYNYAAYHHWHRLALPLARSLHARYRFHVAHQTTVCTFREPGYLWQLGIPFVWGPCGGTQNFPARMLGVLPLHQAAKEAARSVMNRLMLHASPRLRRASRHSAVLFGANSTNAQDLAGAFRRPVQRLLETGLANVDVPDRSRFLDRVQRAQANEAALPLRILWSGQLHPRKALPVLLRALARSGIAFHLDVLGDGAAYARWRAEAQRLALGEHVHFRGRLPFREAVRSMQQADLFCFTSLRDTSGNVVLEALAAGVPVLCFRHQGAADMVSEGSGILIPVTTPKRAVRDWAQALRTLWDDPEQLLALSYGATEQANRFLWSANGDRMNALYRELAAGADAAA